MGEAKNFVGVLSIRVPTNQGKKQGEASGSLKEFQSL